MKIISNVQAIPLLNSICWDNLSININAMQLLEQNRSNVSGYQVRDRESECPRVVGKITRENILENDTYQYQCYTSVGTKCQRNKFG